MHAHPRSFLSDGYVCLLSSLPSKSQRTINRTRSYNIAKALPNRQKIAIPNDISIVTKATFLIQNENSSEICHE
jgi:hypothetical protein